MNLLFSIYKVILLILYLFLSSVLLYHRKIQRWFTFSLGFGIVYVVGSILLFERSPLNPELIQAHLYVALLLAVGGLCAVSLFQEWNDDQFLGALVLLLGSIVVGLATVNGVIGGQSLPQLVKQWWSILSNANELI